jgi:lipopolysaccharide/colanic/teichoic acid biosynthesis glycosyltransferase
MNIVIGFISALLGFCFSPQEGVLHDNVFSGGSIIGSSVIFGLFLGLSSHVNGYSSKMLKRSKLDYIVNLFVSAFIGCLMSVFVLYIVEFRVVGRWVFLITMIVYVLCVFSFNMVMFLKADNRIVVIGSLAYRFCEVLDDLGSERLRQMYDCRKCVDDPDVIYRILESIGRPVSYYVTLDGLGWKRTASKFIDSEFQLFDKMFSVDCVIESELEVVSLSNVENDSWWCVPTKLRLGGYVLLKRFLDISFALLLSLLFAPLFVVSVIAIKSFDGGPVIYRQIRSGLYGKPFCVLKLRTMKVDSEINGVQWAKVGDSRITRVGGFLRKSRLDELPQLWNILCGDMSIIGPRPERPEFYSVIEKNVPQFSLRLCCKPGLTGWAQVNYPYGASIHDAKVKLMYDLFYVKGASLKLDLRILTRTVVAMVKGAR